MAVTATDNVQRISISLPRLERETYGDVNITLIGGVKAQKNEAPGAHSSASSVELCGLCGLWPLSDKAAPDKAPVPWNRNRTFDIAAYRR